MKKYNLPTRKQCFEMMIRHLAPPHIVAHCLTVAKVGAFLAERLKEKGIPVDVRLVDRACLLHDVLRICDLRQSDCARFTAGAARRQKAELQRIKAKYKGICHEDAAYRLLKDKYPALALAVKKHRYAALLDRSDKPAAWEEKLVYYADKRVMHARIAPLKERLQEAHRRYAARRRAKSRTAVDTARVDRLIYKMEKEIFDKIALDPLQVTSEFIDSYPK